MTEEEKEKLYVEFEERQGKDFGYMLVFIGACWLLYYAATSLLF